MTKINSYSTYQQNYYENSVQEKKSKDSAKAEGPVRSYASKTQAASNSPQASLSSKAKKLLEKLKKKYGNMDFMVSDSENGSNAKELLSQGTKEFSVLFSGEELEKMASSETYENEYMNHIDNAVRMSARINEEFGIDSSFGKNPANGQVTKMGISFNKDGSMNFFAELEKTSVQQRERIEQTHEKRAADKKTSSAKRTIVEASSIEELREKIRNVDWTRIREDPQQQSGQKIDYSL